MEQFLEEAREEHKGVLGAATSVDDTVFSEDII